MEDKVIKSIKTSCPFPLLIYKTSVKYNEVRKASGIAYILLELIEKSQSSNERISEVLLKFGIPTDLHYIFGNELAGLIGTDIITSRYMAEHFRNPRYFSEMRVGEVSLTDKGRKMFREGAIPTGAEKTKVKDIYFDPVRRKFDIAFSLPYADISTSCLGEDFIGTIDIDISGMEDYINANPTKMGLKAEERVVSFESEEPQKKATKQDENITITIKQSGVEFVFSTGDENAFFNKYYSSALMKEVMLIKTKYKFYDNNRNAVQVPTIRYEQLGDVNLYIPDDLTKQAGRPCKIYISRNTFGYKRADNTIKIEDASANGLLNGMDNNVEFALLDNSGCKYYRALNVAIPCKQFGDAFEMQLLVESALPQDALNKVVQNIFDLYKEQAWSDESGKVVLYAVEVLHKPECFEEYAAEKLGKCNTVDDKIGVLLQLNNVFKKAETWIPYFERLSEMLFAESVSEIRLDNMIYKNTVLSPLKAAMGISNINYISRFAENVKRAEEPTLVYQALEAAGFTTEEILGVVNVVEVYIRSVLYNESISTDTEIATKFNALRVNLWKLNDMLGVESISDYTIKDNYNVDEFFNAYSTFMSACKAVEKYKQYATKGYDELKRYADIFDPIHDLLSIERTASSHPDKITEKYIDDQIARGKYKDAICDLLVKLQYDLRQILNADAAMPANELIDEARNQRLIDGKQAGALHRLRICRNGLQHPERSQTVFDGQTISEWKDIVFSIQGGNE